MLSSGFSPPELTWHPSYYTQNRHHIEDLLPTGPCFVNQESWISLDLCSESRNLSNIDKKNGVRPPFVFCPYRVLSKPCLVKFFKSKLTKTSPLLVLDPTTSRDLEMSEPSSVCHGRPLVGWVSSSWTVCQGHRRWVIIRGWASWGGGSSAQLVTSELASCLSHHWWLYHASHTVNFLFLLLY